MWDLTPDTDLLKELPEEYSFESALADLIVSLHHAFYFQLMYNNFVVTHFMCLSG